LEQDEWGPPVEPDEILHPTPRGLIEQLANIQKFGDGPVRVGILPGVAFQPYGGRFVLPREFTAVYDVSNEPLVAFRVLVGDTGRVDIDEIQLLRRPGAKSLGGASLRDIPVDKLRRAAMEEAAFEVVQTEDGPKPLRVKDRPEARDELFAAYQVDTKQPARQGVPITKKRLEEVAQVYRDASVTSRRPKQVVASTFHVSTSTASRWIRAAREQGLLGQAMPGRAGEQQEKEENDG
jgi:hypothetical protein